MMQKKDESLAYGSLQIVHDFKFTALNVKDDYSIIDSLDYEGKVENIKQRLDRLHRLGYGGVVMNVDYREYLERSDAFDLFFECAKYAKQLGMRVWIYDEQYYPSGAAGGLTLRDHPELFRLFSASGGTASAGHSQSAPPLVRCSWGAQLDHAGGSRNDHPRNGPRSFLSSFPPPDPGDETFLPHPRRNSGNGQPQLGSRQFLSAGGQLFHRNRPHHHRRCRHCASDPAPDAGDLGRTGSPCALLTQ